MGRNTKSESSRATGNAHHEGDVSAIIVKQRTSINALLNLIGWLHEAAIDPTLLIPTDSSAAADRAFLEALKTAGINIILVSMIPRQTNEHGNYRLDVELAPGELTQYEASTVVPNAPVGT